jgi:Na+-translocating ferredoxin:NAD+ oxidoreductase RnfD subunit
MNPHLSVSALPHIRGRWSVPQMMLITLGALLPAVGVSAVHNGPYVLLVAAVSMAAAAAAEWVFRSAAGKRPVMIDGSAACLTGLLLACSLPPQVPLWMPPIGAVFAVAIVKMAFGGLGNNFLNPALAGRAFCALAFPAVWSSAPSPLVPLPGETLFSFVAGFPGGWIGGASAGALLLGAAVLWDLRIIDATLPASFAGSAFFLFWLAQGPRGALEQITAGGVLLSALFMATDPVTSPKAFGGRLLFGTCCGSFAFLFWRSGINGHNVMYAVLFMNCVVPYIDRFFRPRVEGTKS